MNYSFEYIDIILLAMIAGFIFLRLRGILGKKSGFEEDISTSFPHDYPVETNKKKLNAENFDEKEEVIIGNHHNIGDLLSKIKKLEKAAENDAEEIDKLVGELEKILEINND